MILYQHILLTFLLSLKHTFTRKMQTACCIPSSPMVTNSATNPIFTAGVAVLDFSSTKLYSLNPTFSSFENISIAIGSFAQPLVLTCVYQPPGSCSDGFLDQFLNLLEYLFSVSPSFLICGDFSIHVDTSSNDSVKFQNYLESCNMTQNVHTATHLQGHILDRVLSATDTSGISNVRVAEFISDHALVLCQLNSVNPPSQKNKCCHL